MPLERRIAGNVDRDRQAVLTLLGVYAGYGRRAGRRRGGRRRNHLWRRRRRRRSRADGRSGAAKRNREIAIVVVTRRTVLRAGREQHRHERLWRPSRTALRDQNGRDAAGIDGALRSQRRPHAVEFVRNLLGVVFDEARPERRARARNDRRATARRPHVERRELRLHYHLAAVGTQRVRERVQQLVEREIDFVADEIGRDGRLSGERSDFVGAISDRETDHARLGRRDEDVPLAPLPRHDGAGGAEQFLE